MTYSKKYPFYHWKYKKESNKIYKEELYSQIRFAIKVLESINSKEKIRIIIFATISPVETKITNQSNS